MTPTVVHSEIDLLRDVALEGLGFGLEVDALERLLPAVTERARKLGLSNLGAYLKRIVSTEYGSTESAILAELVTVTETFFFREQYQIDAFVQATMDEFVRCGKKQLRVLSAGCASGEEPYTIAMALRESIPDIATWDLKIVGVDVNPAMLAKAVAARYSSWSLRTTPETHRSRYFSRVGKDYQLCSEITDMVEFRQVNLATKQAWPVHEFAADAIFCRNVIMYFTPEVMRRVVAQLTLRLLPGGFLFLGHAETLRGLSSEYKVQQGEGAFYYQKHREPVLEQRNKSAESLSARRSFASRSVIGENAILLGATSATTLGVPPRTEGREDLRVEVKPIAVAQSRPQLAEVVELMKSEQFSDALSLLFSMPAETSEHPDGLLLAAVLLTNTGRIVEGELACEKLLAADDLNAGAHYLMALCREHAGDLLGAKEHDRIAAHLDPTFSMPHLHAGLIAKRADDTALVRRELERALILLEREDSSRLVLFGGGFSRKSLTALCRTELVRLGDFI